MSHLHKYIFRPTTNPELISEVMLDPNCYELRMGCPPLEETVYHLRPGEFYVACYKGSDLIGLINYMYINGITINIHYNIFKPWWGVDSTDCAVEFRNHLKAFTTIVKCITTIPQECRHSLIFAKRLGFKEEGLITKCHKRGYQTELTDLILLGVNI